MTTLKNSPLIYVLGVIRFPRVPRIDQFTDRFFDQIREEYPLDEKVDMPVFNANVAPDGMRIERQDATLWQFTSVERNWAFVLTDQALCLHTSKYENFINFSDRLEKGLHALNNIPDIGIHWIQTIGFRYVNMITEQPLNEYLQSWILPTEPPKTSLSIAEGAYNALYKTEYGELRVQALRNPPFTLPSELNSPLIIKNGWLKERPSTNFVLIDLDHTHKSEPPKKFEIDTILSELGKLREISKTVFNSIGTDKAKKYWRG
jgi:uncharacterized protein (TIGR04255 family)